MTKKASKPDKKAAAVKTDEQDTTQKLVSGGAPLAAWMEGKPHDLVFAFNPAYADKDNPDEDAWHVILPIEGDLTVIRTGYRGYTPKGDLSQLAMLMMRDPERAYDSAVDYPTITSPRKLKSMHLAVPRLS